MNCERCRDITLLELAGKAGASERREAARHRDACESCRSEASACAEAWRELGSWDVPSLPDGAEAALRRRVALEREGVRARRRRARPRLAAAAAIGVLAGVAATLLVAGGDVGETDAVRAPGPTYLLILRRGPAAADPGAGPALERMVADYAAWRTDLASRGVLLSSNLLDADAGVQWHGGVEGPVAVPGVPRGPGGEYVSGYYLVAAPDLSAAGEIARSSPHLRYGGTIELRPVVTPPEPGGEP